MNVKLKKFSILKPNTEINIGIKTVSRDVTGVVHSPNIHTALALTQAQYDALVENSQIKNDCLYFIVEGVE